jgi:hypothetical protein
MAVSTLTRERRAMSRKKRERKTGMIRVYEDFVEMVLQAAGERRLTVADFCDQFLTPCLERAHRDYIKSESKKLAGGGSQGESGN